jgi:FtsZ-binding cell division protein ZapB
VVKTGEDGNGVWEMEIEELLEEGDSLQVRVEWIAPTREKLVKEISIPVQYSQWSVSETSVALLSFVSSSL